MAEFDRDPVPEADRLEQERPEVESDLDPEAAVGTDARLPDTAEADVADVLEQSTEVTADDDYPTETE
ncbi:hypothetical protein [Antiquaquibacter soli]|uniref:Sugar ABC transporter ATPase n=1 Tax=Antiquaquibacter soli TaxID=3064523 RepID=A0ABT9BQ37_9MICO|nr:hypothetical protein [Protaetiibacter sp. WY-16]MDO7883127.1 hypothetical protein [Protaetiibacter sp. WY-16]